MVAILHPYNRGGLDGTSSTWNGLNARDGKEETEIGTWDIALFSRGSNEAYWATMNMKHGPVPYGWSNSVLG